MKQYTMALGGAVIIAMLVSIDPALLGTASPLADCPSLTGATPNMQPNGHYADDGSWAHACYVVAEQSILTFWLVVVVIMGIGMGIMRRVPSYVIA